jgi:hypothetical protein
LPFLRNESEDLALPVKALDVGLRRAGFPDE